MSTEQRTEFYHVRTTEITPTDLLSRADAKAWLKVEHEEEDDLIDALIATALATVERLTGELLGSTSATIYADAWATQPFTFGPVTAIEAVRYYDQSNTLATLPQAQWWADLNSHPPRITFNAPPAIFTDRHQGVQISATVGHANLPSPLRTAALLLVAHYFENRQQVVTTGTPREVPFAVEALCSTYRRFP